MDVVDYQIRGEEMQFVEIELDPGQAEVGEAGSMMFMDAGIAMDTVFGDGAASQGGLLGKLFGAGKRLITGESLFTTVYTNQGQGKSRGSREEGSLLGGFAAGGLLGGVLGGDDDDA